MRNLYVFLLLLLAAVPAAVRAQQMPGLAASNFSGVYGVRFNPAYVADNRYRFHMNLFSFTTPVSDQGISAYPLLFSGEKRYDASLRGGSSTGAAQLNQYAGLSGLSMLINLGRRHAFALDFQGRAWVQAEGIPEFLGQVYAQGVNSPALAARADAAATDWVLRQMRFGQASLSYGGILLTHKRHFVKAGITVKRLLAGDMYALEADNFSYELKVNGSGAAATRTLALNPFGYRLSSGTNGGGWGGDAGVVYEYRPRYEDFEYFMDGKKRMDMVQNKYRFRLGVALLDAGSVQFTDSRQRSGNTPARNLSETDLKDLADEPLAGTETLLGAPAAETVAASPLRLALPRTLNLDLDVHVFKLLFVNLNLAQGMASGQPHDLTPYSYFTVAPRIEGVKGAEVSFPVTFSQGAVLPGIALRAGPLFAGVTNVPGLLGRGTVRGGMAFAGIVIWDGRRKEKDQDNDAVSDSRDICKDIPGIWEFKGCPDSDLDGVEDKVDECPTVAGSKELKGCPDTDRDGILDKNDQCPDLAGSAQYNGCPDTDGDQIPDSEDACPEKAGVIAFNGCPDTDNDNVADDKDLCPAVAGLPELDGCPDTDADGIPDKDDTCPEKAGLAAGKGCPDADGDGVYDNEDLCPTQKGVAAGKGCPDTDADGVPDKDDECPKMAGAPQNKGCPVLTVNYDQVDLYDEEKAIVQAAEDELSFTGKYAAVDKNSAAALNKLAAFLKSKPNYRLLILELQHFENKPDDEPREGRGQVVEKYFQNKQVSWGQLLTETYWIEQTEGIKKNTRSYILFRIIR